MKTTWRIAAIAILVSLISCSEQREVKITGPGIESPVTYEYLKPFFDSRCASAGCHDQATAAGGYEMSTYGAVITRATAGDANSRLLTKIQEDGSMYIYLGDYPETKIEAIRRWIVEDGLLEP